MTMLLISIGDAVSEVPTCTLAMLSGSRFDGVATSPATVLVNVVEASGGDGAGWSLPPQAASVAASATGVRRDIVRFMIFS
jgi:hypothetical protein